MHFKLNRAFLQFARLKDLGAGKIGQPPHFVHMGLEPSLVNVQSFFWQKNANLIYKHAKGLTGVRKP